MLGYLTCVLLFILCNLPCVAAYTIPGYAIVLILFFGILLLSMLIIVPVAYKLLCKENHQKGSGYYGDGV